MKKLLDRQRCMFAASMAVAVTMLVACSSSSTSSAASGAAKTITVMTWSSYTAATLATPENLATVKAGIASLNAAGGINGDHVKLISCDNLNSPDGQINCVREAVSDHVSAVIGSETTFEPAEVFALLQQAKIAYIGGAGVTPNELSSPVSFGAGGLAAWFVGSAATIQSQGFKHPAIIKCEIVNCSYSATVISTALKSDGISVVRSVTAPLATTDYSAIAADAVRGDVDSIVFSGSPAQLLPLRKALNEQGFKGPVVLPDAELPSNYQSVLSGVSSELLVAFLMTPSSDTGNPAIAKFRAAMAKYAPSSAITPDTVRCWWAVQLFAAIAAKAGGVSSAQILAAAQSLKIGEIKTGITAPVPVAATSPVKAYPSVGFDPLVQYVKIQGGKVTPIGPFVNPFTS